MRITERKEFTFESKALPQDTFSVVRFRGIEAMSRPYEFDITLASRDPEIDLKTVLRNPATLTFVHGGGDLPFHGVLAGFEQLHEVKQHALYRAVLVPKLWNAGLYRENQIFLDKTVPQIIEEILKQAGMSGNDYELNLTRDYPAWEYICQYRETDLDFISRWMEREGIFYFFDQTEHGAKMILSDSLSIHRDITGDTDIPYSPPSGLVASEKEIVAEFTCRRKALPAKVVLKDHNYRKPGLELRAEASVDPEGRGEVCIYGEHFKSPGEGDVLAKVRAEELLCRETEFHGEATAPAFSPGFFFGLSGHYRGEYNRKYLILEVRHEGSRAEDLLAGLGENRSKQEEEPGYRNRFVCIPAGVQFRPERKTPRPKFHGAMNAFVDAAGDGKFAELDDQGRYKVVLPLDLSGRKGGKATRFIRMAQPYSGFAATDGTRGPSGMHFPLHKGAEVLLTFVDGDPDRPVISGAIPNPETISPVTSANQTKSAVRDNFGNELIFDSTPGDEHIRLYSPHHSSGIELGRSLMKWTKSDESGFVTGNKIEVLSGNKGSFEFGNSFDMKAGQFWDLKLGYGTSVMLGGGVTLNWAYDLKSNLGPIVNTTAKDILSAAGKDQILSAGDQVCIIGGESAEPKRNAAQEEFARERGLEGLLKRPPKDESRSIVNVFPEKLVLSVSNKSDTYKIGGEGPERGPIGSAQTGEIFSKTPPRWGLFSAVALPALFGVTQFVASAVTDLAHDDYRSAQGTDSQKIGYMDGVKSLDGAVGVLGGIMSAMSVWYLLRKYIQEKAIEPVGHKDPADKIELDHDGKVLINSKEKSVVIRVGANNDHDLQGSGLRLDKEEILLGRKENLANPNSRRGSLVQMSKNGNVILIAEDSQTIVARKGSVKIKSKEFHGPGGTLKVLQ
ncbi:MAG: type VI secretion system tip protein VgrG [Acidobacteria bacterium]|nr:type VI secretion system tip protein VgrG [Acidobacteriota bacterium]